MVHRGPDHRKSDRDIHTGFNSEHLDRSVALVVIHGNHHIEIAALRQEEERVGRQWSNHIPSLLAAGSDCRCDLFSFFAVTEETVFSRMRIDSAHTYLRIGIARFLKHSMRTRNGSLHKSRLDLCNRIDQADVRGHMSYL